MSNIRFNPEFYHEKPASIPSPIANILEAYSDIPKDQQLEHILKVRDRAYGAHPYPCLGRFRFLELDLSTHPLYQDYVLPQLKRAPSDDSPNKEPVFLDLGTCLGQDLRKLVVDGADPARLFGSDIVPDFIDAGYELFRDESRLPRDHFICPADVFDETGGNVLSTLHDTVDILHATAVFHLFSEEQQAPVARQCMKLIRKDPGTRSLILGGQAGNVEARQTERSGGTNKFRHDEKSWKILWETVCGQEEFRHLVKSLEVKVELQQRTIGQAAAGQQQKHIGSTEEGFRWMVWQVWVDF